MPAKTRETNIELLRVLLMFGICFLHSITAGPFNRAGVANVFMPCVVGFVFISGWFGVRFSVKKIILLYLTAFWAATVYSLYSMAVTGSRFFPVAKWVIVDSSWFLHAYVFLMILAPILNCAVEGGGWKVAVPFLFAIFGWGFAGTLPFVREWIPSTSGLEAYSGVTLAGIYVIARLIRKYELMRFMTPLMTAGAFLGSLVACAAGAGDYNSPFALLLAISVFRCFQGLRIGTMLGRVVGLLAPSMFFVYVVHGHGAFFRMPHAGLAACEEWMRGGGAPNPAHLAGYGALYFHRRCRLRHSAAIGCLLL